MKIIDARLREKSIQPSTCGHHPRAARVGYRLKVASCKLAACVSQLATILLGGVLFSGCASSKSASASFASVVIANQSVETIQDTTMLVFGEAGYKANRAADGSMVFEMEGSRGDQILYGGLGGAQYNGSITVRVKAEIVDLMGQDAHRLQCQAYMVRHAGEGLFEDKQRLANFRRGPYQKILDEVATKLKFK